MMNLNELINQFQKIEKKYEIITYLNTRLADKKAILEELSERFSDDDDVNEQREKSLWDDLNAYEAIIEQEKIILDNYLGKLLRIIMKSRII